jgi:hypothetical protein
MKAGYKTAVITAKSALQELACHTGGVHISRHAGSPVQRTCIDAESTLRADTIEAALREALAGLDAFLATQSGFIRRRSVCDATSAWTWSSGATAPAPMPARMQ